MNGTRQDRGFWNVLARVDKWDGDRLRRLGLHTADELTAADLEGMGLPPDEVVRARGNLLLNEGIQDLWDLVIAAGGGEVAYNNANARLGVGNSSTAASATDTGLLGGSTLFKSMDATFPSRTAQTVDFKASFTDAEANFAWEEWSVDNGAARNRNLNRKVTSLGTKASGTWALTVSITIS